MKKKNWIYPLIITGMFLMLTFSCKKDDDNNSTPTGPVPILTTSNVSAIGSTHANCGGNITSDEGSTVTARGVCWGTGQTPTMADSKTSDGSGAGIFTSNITGLTPFTTYYVRAYATNSNGTAYGSTMSFTTTEPAVGDSYGGGIVFFKYGGTGLIMAPVDQSTGAPWGCEGTFISGTLGSGGSRWNSDYNTNLILNGCNTPSIAAEICANLTLNGYSDWSLPTYWACHDMGLSTPHWSSSEIDATQAYAFSGSNEVPTNKSTLLAVRAVRQFTY